MTKFTDSIHVAHHNPFIMAPLFTNFFYSLEETEKNYLFCYLLLPLVLREDRREFLVKSNISSSIHTFKSKESHLVSIADDVYYYKQLTNNSIQHAIDNGWIIVNEDLSVTVIENQKNMQENLSKSYTASRKVSNILGNLDVVTIYRLLGIRSI